jgi:hypothetical protein
MNNILNSKINNSVDSKASLEKSKNNSKCKIK